jgi:hypothetical protein
LYCGEGRLLVKKSGTAEGVRFRESGGALLGMFRITLRT